VTADSAKVTKQLDRCLKGTWYLVWCQKATLQSVSFRPQGPGTAHHWLCCWLIVLCPFMSTAGTWWTLAWTGRACTSPFPPTLGPSGLHSTWQALAACSPRLPHDKYRLFSVDQNTNTTGYKHTTRSYIHKLVWLQGRGGRKRDENITTDKWVSRAQKLLE
jgi:hypothetical protein